MYKLNFTTKFKKDLKKIKKKPDDFGLVSQILMVLESDGVRGVPKKMKAHKLKGTYNDNWECHVKPDLLIIWFQIEDPATIKMVRVGSHSDLFR